MTKRHLIIYFLLLFLTLGIFLFPTFSNPPHVDYWEAFFTFHQVYADPDLSVWPYIISHDPWRHGTFRPFFYTILYLEHRAFGSGFVWNHLTNFFWYCLLLVLLFLLGRRLGARRPELAGFIAVLAVLYSHCDILTLTFHLPLIFSLSANTAAFILYFNYLERRSGRVLFAVGFFFLLGMLCYEPFLFYPAGIFILALTPGTEQGRSRLLLRTTLLLTSIYLLYGVAFLFTRSSSYYLSGDLPAIEAGRIMTGFFMSFFNLLYTGLGVNLCPFIGSPPIYKGYSEMGGVIPIGNPSWLIPVARGAGITALIFIGAGAVLLLRRRHSWSALVAATFLLYLNLSFFFLLTTGRSTTNNLSHILRQFRYQLAPNAFLLLAGAVLVSALTRPTRRNRKILFSLLAAVFAVNLYCTTAHFHRVTRHLRPLEELLTSLRSGIKSGEISPSQPLYLPDGTPASFHHLCWNRSMGRKMWGTYQWIFSRRRLRCFTPLIEEAVWVADPEKRNYHRNITAPTSLPGGGESSKAKPGAYPHRGGGKKIIADELIPPPDQRSGGD